MTYEAKSKKLYNEENLPNLDEVAEDQRLLGVAMLKRIAETGKP